MDVCLCVYIYLGFVLMTIFNSVYVKKDPLIRLEKIDAMNNLSKMEY